MDVRSPLPVYVTDAKIAWGWLLLGLGGLLFALAVVIYVCWLMLASVTATPFDADGVRCYHRGAVISCIKTANPGG
jgi:hypothetical protein